ncbi:glucose/galactose MFS transporter [Mucilaginibacter sabulilitoris]|uniref:Glucose/galactose MFS transporter n=1 Tax=Mucilaginibacter sabulilitoris TaxID=1173583 RepID=A0ABZ0TM80_9SPHI|nr:glucose/galactose MFS transporter [Mucilaginibacter sabulilitoris]WPU92839.1 glucose/galactose MFS transporter [Mucilaginibacter sabulilitoris]
MALFAKKNSPMLIIGFLFFVFGFVSWLNAILIPYFRLSLQLSINEAMMVTFAFYISYFVMAFPSSRILRVTGFKKGMMYGLFVMAAGAILFIPAANFKSYTLFLTGLFVQATGLTLLQTAANPYVTILGPMESAAKRMSIMGICNKIAGAFAPLIFLKIVTKTPDEIDHVKKLLPLLSPLKAQEVMTDLIHRMVMPYFSLGIILVFLGLLVRYSSLPDIKEQQTTDTGRSTIKARYLLLGAIAIFCGVSAEVLAVDTIISFAEYKGVPFYNAKYFATFTLVAMIIAYLIGIIAIPRYIKQRMALFYSSAAGLLITCGLLFTPGKWAIWELVLAGFFNALLWPSIWPLALEGLAADIKRASAYLVTGIVGGALTPLLFGSIAGRLGLQQAYVVMFPLYVFLLYYSSWGYAGIQQYLVSVKQPEKKPVLN